MGVGIVRHIDTCRKITEALKLTVNNETDYLLNISCVSDLVLLCIHYHLVRTLYQVGTVSFILHRRKQAERGSRIN